jgi:hypothetical protein
MGRLCGCTLVNVVYRVGNDKTIGMECDWDAIGLVVWVQR